jgi:hypothetical protein
MPAMLPAGSAARLGMLKAAKPSKRTLFRAMTPFLGCLLQALLGAF